MLDLLATFLIAAGASRAVLAVQVWWAIVLVPAMIFGVWRFGLTGAGWTHVAVGLLAVLPAYLIFLRRQGINCLRFLRAWITPTVPAVPTVVGCWLIGAHVEPPLLAILLGGLTAIVLYVVPLTPWFLREIRTLRKESAANTDRLSTPDPVDPSDQITPLASTSQMPIRQGG
jgi:PST family polysaccharide transporter